MNKIVPINFLSEYDINGHKIKYVNFRELGQGGPEVGRIEINGNLYGKSEYGGPLLQENDKVYIPLLRGRSFTLTCIDLNTLESKIYNEVTSNILLLKAIEDNVIYFYNKLNNENLMSYDLSKTKKQKRKKWIFW